MRTNNIKVNVNRPKLTTDEVNKHKDFKSIMYSYSRMKKPLYKQPKFLSGLVVMAIVSMLVYFESKEKQPQEKKEVLAFINPPLASANIVYERYNVDATQGKELIYKTGSTITIPAEAFVDDKGKIIKGDIEIRYREFHNPIDFFLSGIPMTYDSAGTQYHFESAGMLEILAYKDGLPVNVNPEKQIYIKMASYQEGTDFNLYELDTLQRNWVYKGKDRVIQPAGDERNEMILELESAIPAPVQKLEKEISKIKTEIKQLETTKPVSPKKADPARYKFNIDVDPKEFPELAIYKEMYFEIGDENRNFKPEMAKITWEDAALAQGKLETNYMLTLTKGKESHKLSVYSVFEGKEYDAAIKMYNDKFKDYQEKLSDRKAEEKRKQEEYTAYLKKMEEERVIAQKQYEEEQKKMEAAKIEQQKNWNEQQKKQWLARETESKIYRAFSINGFGRYNCDSPQMLPQGKKLIASFTDDNKSELDLSRVYLIEKGRNAIFTYYSSAFNAFSYNPKKENMIWGVTIDNRFVVFRPEDFAQVEKSVNSHEFKMRISDKQFSSAEEIKGYLEI